MSRPSPLALALLLCIQVAFGFIPGNKIGARSSNNKHALQMAPKFNKSTQKWEITDGTDTEGAYGPVGSLIRQGPVPFFKRVTDPDLYEQMVLKYMANDKCGRAEAQGNMDAYLANPSDWAYQKNAEKNGAAKYDYANANTDPGQLVLTGTWAVFVTSLLGRVIYVFVTEKM
mmetsp:Transcript_13541/g.20632  ORF Transcript_13541/g.20632 Transcript_13541/m.20632 type:complete len:172 (-) Transcript_13541:153-668(-)|eukprot:CAMPEP_0196816496 /NCGR_PEP_ID=MMETSP1362-20130617/55716_1 /TAXON_ID=163516 /ORGANISM="Leptocylindrus danicus, Strain CCMP1856" /LENGTH=171 /DNA_ID=CAMNT_0042193863 /DNA_START=42 /DNA_END=557 /DNA_ORIENTATION=+